VRGERLLSLALFTIAVFSLANGALTSNGQPYNSVALAVNLAWTEPLNISNTGDDSRTPAMAVDGSGVVHVVWEEGDRIYHSYGSGQNWSPPSRVATGERPAIAIDGQNRPHVVFANEIGGNFEIYYVRWEGSAWSLPRNVSSTSGVSSNPDIAIADDGTIHVVWADNTPGYSVIYHAKSTNGTLWSNFPIPSANGGVPAIAIGDDGIVHVSWQNLDEEFNCYDIYHSQWDGSAWSLPENISDSLNDSTIADMAVAGDNTVHLVWEERVGGNYEVYYSGGWSFNWSVQENVSNSAADSYLPSIAIDGDGTRHVAWEETASPHCISYRKWQVATSSWLESEAIATDPVAVSDPVLFADSAETLHIVWVEYIAPGNWDIFYSTQGDQAPPTPSNTPTATPTETVTPTSTPRVTQNRIYLPIVIKGYP